MAKKKSNRLPPVATDFTNSWAKEVAQYDAFGAPGISFEEHQLPFTLASGSIDIYVSATLIYRGPGGDLEGILNYFPKGFPEIEAPGNFLVIVDPACRNKGIALKLLTEADLRWSINFQQQIYTTGGRALASAFLKARSSR